jgi:hypothetical protein
VKILIDETRNSIINKSERGRDLHKRRINKKLSVLTEHRFFTFFGTESHKEENVFVVKNTDMREIEKDFVLIEFFCF